MKAKSGIFHDPSETEILPGEDVPEWILEAAPWLVANGDVVDDAGQAEAPVQEDQDPPLKDDAEDDAGQAPAEEA